MATVCQDVLGVLLIDMHSYIDVLSEILLDMRSYIFSI